MKRQIWSGILLILLFMALGFPLHADAIGPELVQVRDGTGNQVCVTHSCSLAFSLNVGSGDVIIVGWGGNGQPCRPGDVGTSVSDTFGTVFGLYKVSADDAADLYGAALWSAVAPSSGPDTVTVNTIDGPASGCLMIIWDLSSSYIITATPSAIASNALTNAGSPFTTSTTNVLNAGYFAVAFIYANGATTGSAGTSFTSLLHFGGGTVTGAQYSDTVASPTNYPVVCSTGGCSSNTAIFVEAGMIMPTGLHTVVTTTLVQGCTFTELQCWWYPMMFLGMYLGFFVGAAMAFKFSEKGFAYFLLAGSTYASLIEISLGLMNATIPIMFIAVNIGYSFRLDRIVTSLASR